MRKTSKIATIRRPAQAPRPELADFATDPALDDPHDAIDQELLGIWLSISRVRQLVRAQPARRIATKTLAEKATQPRRPRRKAA